MADMNLSNVTKSGSFGASHAMSRPASLGKKLKRLFFGIVFIGLSAAIAVLVLPKFSGTKIASISNIAALVMALKGMAMGLPHAA